MAKRNQKRSSKLSSEATKIKKLSEQVKNLKMTKSKSTTPFANTGKIIGSSIGSMFGNSAMGGGIGKWLGSGIGSIFGSGDYQIAGTKPDYNVLTNGKQIPQFSTTHATNIVCHREYLGDILGTAAFNNTAYPLNPGLAQTFPWLSTIAENYQEYKFHGIIFEFRPLITDFVTSGAPGVVVMATNYNSDVPVYSTKQEMENSEFAVSVKPTLALMHGVECDIGQTILPQRYVRTGSVATGQDLRLYDYGNFQFATQSNPVQNLGELWVSYCVEFFKPVLPNTVGGDINTGHVVRSSSSGTVPFGTATVSSVGTLALVVTSTSITWFAQPGTQWKLDFFSAGVNAVIVNPVTSISGNASFKQWFVNPSGADNQTQPTQPPATTTSISYMFSVVIVASSSSAAGYIGLTISTGGTLPTSAYADIWVTQIDNAITG
jgi:hypothetical protein